jgi:hypothetical protein
MGFIGMLLGVGFVYAGSLDSGILAAVVGAVVEGAAGLVFVQARKAQGDSQQNLQLLAETVREDNNREIAMHLISMIDDAAERDAAVADLARQAMRSATDGKQSTPTQPAELPEGRSTAPSSEGYLHPNSGGSRVRPPENQGR